ncbi:acyltransferase family protein [Clostridium isatidis]|uniref:acyltransferase family protein n=1 Tax=Clostridium isatidis TaxID=182773 RepID=UPI003AACF6DA
MEKRLSWIDVLKGLGMVLVMFAHASIPDDIRKYIYTFHLPLFFCISGYLFSTKKYNTFAQFLKSKSKTLLIPYLVFSLFNYLFYLLFSRFANTVAENPLKPLLGIFVGVRGTEWTICNGTLWFVLALFISEILLYLIIRLTKGNNKKISLILILFSELGYSYSKFIGVKLIWNIDAALVAVTFVGLGYIVKKSNMLNKLDDYIYIIIFMLLNFIFGELNTEISMFSSIYGNYFYFYISAITGTLGIILICKKINSSKMLEFIGQNTFVYLAIHQYVIFSVLKKITGRFITNSSGISLVIIAIGYVLFTVVILYIPIKIINRFFPYIVGKSNNNIENNTKINS